MSDKPSHEITPVEQEDYEVIFLPPLPIAAERIPAGTPVYIGTDGKVHPVKVVPDIIANMTEADRRALAAKVNAEIGRDVF